MAYEAQMAEMLFEVEMNEKRTLTAEERRLMRWAFLLGALTVCESSRGVA